MKKKRKATRPTLNNKDRQLREWLIAESARIYVSENVKDLHNAKLKAAKHLNITDTSNLPGNSELEAAIKEYRRLFFSASQNRGLQHLQQQAVNAMTFFSQFKPKIVGALQKGTASDSSTIHLHLFTDLAEKVDWFLLENRIPHDTYNKTYYLNKLKRPINIPAYRFIADENPLELSVFPEIALRQQVRCSPKGLPIERENLANFKRLLLIEE